MASPFISIPTFKPQPQTPPQGGGSRASGNLFSPKAKITVKGIGTPQLDGPPPPNVAVMGPVNGMLKPGNINLYHRPTVHNADGSISTVRSITVTDDKGHAYLIPTVVGNKVVSNEQAVHHWEKTGQHLGVFADEASADTYARTLHDNQAADYLPRSREIDQQAQAYAQQQAVHRAAVENAGTISTHGIVSPIASKAAAAHQVVQEQAQPIPHYSDTPRYTPHFAGEPIAGHASVFATHPISYSDPKTTPEQRPYYTDANTAKEMPKGGTGLQSVLGSTTEPGQQKTLAQVYKDNHPLGQAVIAGLASAIPGVATAKKFAEGEHPTAGTVGTEAMNILGFAGGGEIDAVRAGIGALKSGKSIAEAVQVTRDAARASRAARVTSILQDEHVDPRVKEAVAGAHAAPNPDAFIQKDNPLLDSISEAQGKPVVEPTPETPPTIPDANPGMHHWERVKQLEDAGISHSLAESLALDETSVRGFQRRVDEASNPAARAHQQKILNGQLGLLEQRRTEALAELQSKHVAARGVPPTEAPSEFWPEDAHVEPASNGAPHPPVEEPAPALSTAEQVQQGLRGARAARKQQDAGYSAERAARFARAEAIMHDASLDPIERHIQAKAQLRGELPKINWGGFTELDDEALSEMVRTIQEDPHLLAGQRIRAADALQGAVGGRVPTPSELTLIEHIFGKAEVANGLREISVHPLRGALMSILNIPRSIMSSADLSAPFRQGIVAGARHPAMFAKNFGPMIKAMKSPEYHAATERLIKNDPDYPRAMAGGLRLTDFEGVREEPFPSNAAEKLNLRSIPGPLKGKKYATGIGDLIAASGRAYVTFLNKMRMDMFKYHLRMARERDATIVDNEKFLRDLSRVINNATGTGDGGKMFEASAAALNTFLFSPRLLKSRLNFLNPIWYWSLHPYARRLAMRSFFQLGAEATAFVGMLSLVPGVKIATDPRNPDWGKVRVGNTRFDIGGGFQQPIRLAAQIWTAVAISSTTGHRLSLTAAGFGKPTRLDLFIRFFEGKESPIASFVTDAMRGTNQVGQPFKWSSEAYQRITPLLAQDAYDLYNSKQGGVNGIAAAAAGYGIGTFGFGIQTYGPTPPGQKAVTQLQKDATQAGFGTVPHEFLIDLGHMKGLDTISAQNPKNPNAKLQAAIAYYTKETGDTSFDALRDQSLPDATAENYYLSIRHVMVGPGLAQYEANVKRVLDAEKAAK